jgi:hypothetical protein
MSALSDWRPIRPKPLMPTRVDMVRDLLDSTFAPAVAERVKKTCQTGTTLRLRTRLSPGQGLIHPRSCVEPIVPKGVPRS